MSRKFDHSRDPGETSAPRGLACRYCHDPCSWEELSRLGARCFRCYSELCSMTIPQLKARYDAGKPARALPRREGYADLDHVRANIAQHIAAGIKRPDRATVRGYADDLGIDVGDDA